ncbi:hypothetical protein G3A39_39395 [Paraburkholderia aspalathi]|nr:hypothetical protein [Paraburkholderia aspalathi]
MAKTSTERMRELRARKREMKKEVEKALAPTTYVKPLSTFFSETQRTGFSTYAVILGDKWWDFKDDDGIQPFDMEALDDEEMKNASNSLGKAELLLSVFQDIVTALSSDINAYKRSEINERIREIETLDFSDPDTRKNALANMMRLQKMLDHLNKDSRWTMSQWEVSID